MKKLKTIFLDIETASAAPSYDLLDDKWKGLWSDKVKYVLPQDETPATWYEKRAGVMAEFARVICISIGYFDLSTNKQKFYVCSFAQGDERKLLQDFSEFMERLTETGFKFIAGHNIREFDIPFLCRRMLIKKIDIPKLMDFQEKKPWDIPVIDTFQLWRFGDYKNFTSLHLLAELLDIPSSKDEMDGSMVGEYYWTGDSVQRRLALSKIVEYCQKDVVVTTEIFLRLTSQVGITEGGATIIFA